MNFKIILCLFCTLLVFAPQKEFAFLKKGKGLPQVSSNPLINAYFTGNKVGLSKKVKRYHDTLNLHHLMTPSGLHLASLVLVFSFFSKSPRLLFLALSVLGFFIVPYSGIDSLKRMLLFGILRKNPLFTFSLKQAYLATFIIAFIMGQYYRNPLSYALSFVFIGALLYSKNRLRTFFSLLAIQFLLSHWLSKSIDPLGALLGLILSLGSTFVFPLFFLELLFPKLPFTEFWTMILKILSSWCVLPIKFPFWSFLPLLVLNKSKRLRILTIGVLACLIAIPLSSTKKTNGFSTPPPRNFQTKKPLNNGTKFTYENGMRCYSRLKGDRWSHRCHK